jgi:(2Fe-2S) ferredoxin
VQFYRSHVLVCGGTPCVLEGCRAVRDALIGELKRLGLDEEVRVIETGCLGPCDLGPVIVVYPEGTLYEKVAVSDVPRIVEEHLLKGRIVRSLTGEGRLRGIVSYEEPAYLETQERIVLRNCGIIDPSSIEEYIASDGYRALAKCLTEMEPCDVIEVIKRSGLVGRGGAAFPTGLKWSFTANADADEKFIICNADEGEPGTFKDRLILEGDPHSILEAMAIAGYAVGAQRGFVYIRGEYGLNQGIQQAKAMGLLGEDIFGAFGSGKTEVALNFAKHLQAPGKEVAIVDFDIVNPYFRSREVASVMKDLGIGVISSSPGLEAADLPSISPAVLRAFQDPALQVVFDVGGDPVGAKALSGFRRQFKAAGYDMYFVVNANRPFTQDVAGALAMLESIERASQLSATGIVSNTHLGKDTKPEDILRGIEISESLGRELDLPLVFACAGPDIAESVGNSLGTRLLTLDLHMRPPWERIS